MTTQYSFISEITPTMPKWIVKVIVCGKHSPKQARNNSGRYQYVDFMDFQGELVSASIYGGNITALGDQLVLGKTYSISDATVKLNNPDYKVSKGTMHWTLTGKTKIKQLDEDMIEFLYSRHTITPFHEFQNHMDTNNSINIVAVVLNIRPKKNVHGYNGNQTVVQEIVLINRDFKTIILTLWDTFVEREGIALAETIDEKPVLWATNIKVASYNGLNLSTKSDSSFFIDIPIAELLEYKEWINQNVQAINSVNHEEHTSSRISPEFNENDGKKLFSVYSILNGIPTVNKRFYWLKARTKITSPNQSYWYIGCNYCNKIASANLDEMYHCVYCENRYVRATARIRVTLQLEDDTGVMEANAIGPIAEELLHCTAESITKHFISESNEPLESIIQLSSEKELHFYIKAIMSKQDQNECQYEILFVVDPSQIKTPTLAIQENQNINEVVPSNVLANSTEIPSKKKSVPQSILTKRKLKEASIPIVDDKLPKKKSSEAPHDFVEPIQPTTMKLKIEKP